MWVAASLTAPWRSAESPHRHKSRSSNRFGEAAFLYAVYTRRQLQYKILFPQLPEVERWRRGRNPPERIVSKGAAVVARRDKAPLFTQKQVFLQGCAAPAVCTAGFNSLFKQHGDSSEQHLFSSIQRYAPKFQWHYPRWGRLRRAAAAATKKASHTTQADTVERTIAVWKSIPARDATCSAR